MSEWQKVKIGDFLKRYKNPVVIQDDTLYKRVTIKTKHQGISVRDEKFGEKIGTKKQFTVKSGQFLLSKIDARYGAFGIVSKEVDGAIITGNFWAYDVDEYIVSVEWLNQFTNSNGFYDLCERSSSGITHRKYLNEKKFLDFELSIPSIDKQRDIVRRNDYLKNKYDNFQYQNSFQQSHLALLRQQILQDAISGKLTKDWRAENPNIEPASKLLEQIKVEKEKLIAEKKLKKEKLLPPISLDEVPFALPEGWEWCRLGEITNIVRGGSPRPAGDKRFYEGDIPFLKVADLTATDSMYLETHTYTIKEAGLYKTRQVPTQTLMLTNSGATLGIPKICTFETTFNDGIAAFIYMNEDLFKPFFYYLLKSKTQWFLKEASRGQGQPNLNTDIIGDTLIPLPPRAEQRAIVAKVERLMGYVSQLEEKIVQNANSAETLIQAFLGEVFRK